MDQYLFCRTLGALACACLLLIAGPAWAQQNAAGSSWERFHPGASQHTSLLNLDRPEVLDHMQVSGGIFTHFVDDPVQVLSPDGERVASRVVDDQLKVEAGGSIGLFDLLQLNVAIPVIPYQTGTGLTSVGGDSDASGAYVSEIRATVDAPLVRPSDNGGFGLGLSGRVSIPSGADASFNSDAEPHGGPTLSAIWRTRSDFELVANLGFELRSRNQIRNYLTGHSVNWGVGGVVPLPFGNDRLSALATVSGQRTVIDPVDQSSANQFGPARGTTEALGGVRLDLSEQWRLQAGGGTGITEGVGAPDFRLFASLHVRTGRADDTPEAPASEPAEEPEPEAPSDRDGDGIVDADDECPDDPETFNGVDDDDGCPDADEALVEIVKLEIRLDVRIKFETNKADLRSDEDPVLEDVTTLLAAYPELSRIRIEGHADSRGTEQHNQKLSERRAETVRQYLVDNGIAADRLVAEGRGEREPTGDNRTAEGQQQNRRVDFVILEVDGESVEGQKSIEFERLVE